MAKMIQLRNVPDSIHRTLKVRAAQESMALSDYILRELRDIAERPTIDEIMRRVEQLPAVPGIDVAKDIRQERAKRDRHLDRR
jgi:plasmid stability protein